MTTPAPRSAVRARYLITLAFGLTVPMYGAMYALAQIAIGGAQ